MPAYVPPHLRRAAAATPVSDDSSAGTPRATTAEGVHSDRGSQPDDPSNRFSGARRGFDSGGGGPFHGRTGGKGDAVGRRFDGDGSRRLDAGGGAPRGDARGRFDGGSSSGRRAKGAPSRFGSIGRAMEGALRQGEDVAGGVRVDEEGMVYVLGDGTLRYFQDRGRKYPFSAGPEALPLLRGLLATNERVNRLSQERVEATGNAEATLRYGESLYVEKPTMKSSKGCGTWSDEEYAHPGLQAIYLRLKSFQRFTESWALYERVARHGTFDRYLRRPAAIEGATAAAPLPPLRVASLGGGPGYELLALEWFLRFWAAVGEQSAETQSEWLLTTTFDVPSPARAAPGGACTEPTAAAAAATAEVARLEVATARVVIGEGAAPPSPPPPAPVPPASTTGEGAVGAEEPSASTGRDGAASAAAELPPLHLVSLDLQPSWAPYVQSLRGRSSSAAYSFAQWDVHAAIGALAASARADPACDGLELCVISNVMVYCTDEATADVLAALVTTQGVDAILMNERGAEQKIVDMLTQRGVVVVRLLNQAAGRDDRQLLVLPPGTVLPGTAPPAAGHCVFPNVPYEENKQL